MDKKNKGIDSPENDSSIKIENGADKKNSRRKILKKTLTGGAVISAGVASSKWSKPVIDLVVLPAHAQTSMPDDGSGGSTTDSPGGGTTTATPTTTTATPTTTTATPTTTTATPTTTTTQNPNSNINSNFTFFDWTENIA